MLRTHFQTRFLVVPFITLLLRKPIHFEVTLRCNPESVSHAIEERKHRRDVDRLCNLRLSPTMIAQLLHIFIGGAVGRFSHLGDVFEEHPLGGAQAGCVQIAFSKGRYCFSLCSLNTQEVCMRVQSIWTAVEPGYPTRDCFLGLSVEMAMGKVNGVTELHNLAKKIGAMAEAFENAGHKLTA